MGATDFNHFAKGRGLFGQRRLQLLQRGTQVAVQRKRHTHVQDGRHDIVGGLPEIDIVVRVHGTLRPDGLARELTGPVGDHFVGVHVRRRARPGLKHIDRELLQPLARCDLARDLLNELTAFGWQAAQCFVGVGAGLLNQTQRTNKTRRQAVSADGEIQDRPLSRGTKQGVVRHLHRAHGIIFCAHGDKLGQARPRCKGPAGW